MSTPNGHGVAGLIAMIDDQIGDLEAQIQQLKEAKRRLRGVRKSGPSPKGKRKAGDERGGRRAPKKAGAAHQNKNWTAGDEKKLRALATWAGSAEFDAATAADALGLNTKSLSAWLSVAFHKGKVSRPEKGVYKIKKGA